MNNQIDISIIIVNWNVRELLRKALLSIQKAEGSLNIETIVIDNASGDRSANMVKNDFKDVTLIANVDNKGFAAANNQGLEIATGRFIFILNPDTELFEDTLLNLVKYMELHLDVAVVSPKLLNTDGSLQPSCRRFPKLRFEIFRKLFLDQLLPKTYFNGYMMGDFKYDEEIEVDQPMGAAIFIRKNVVDQVGYMDDHNFVWFDEVDWCFQIKKADNKIMFYPGSKLYHHQGKSFKRWKNPFSGIVWQKSRFYFISKNYGKLSAYLFIAIDVLSVIFYLFVFIIILKALI